MRKLLLVVAVGAAVTLAAEVIVAAGVMVGLVVAASKDRA